MADAPPRPTDELTGPAGWPWVRRATALDVAATAAASPRTDSRIAGRLQRAGLRDHRRPLRVGGPASWSWAAIGLPEAPALPLPSSLSPLEAGSSQPWSGGSG